MVPRTRFFLRVSMLALLGAALFSASKLPETSAGYAHSASPGGVPMKPDQVNTAGWDQAWTNLVNDVEQGFRPSQPKLLAVEVELVVGNPGTGKDEVTLTILDKSGEEVTTVTQTVLESDCENTLFYMPDDGVDVTPGESYRIKLSGGTTFGWKYVVGGYPKGHATFNRKPLLRNAKSSFLFRTFSPE